MGFLFVLCVLVAGWLVGNLIGWIDFRRNYVGRFNVRIFLGPRVYLSWLDEVQGNWAIRKS